MNLQDFLTPFDIQKITPSAGFKKHSLGSAILSNINDIGSGEFDIALLGVEEDRQAVDNTGCALASDYIREKLYLLKASTFKASIADLGNIRQGASAGDTYAALRTVVSELIKAGILPVIIGGSQDLTYAQFLAYEMLERRVDLVLADSHFDLEEDPESKEIDSHNFLGRIILHEPNYLFNISHIGYQTYFADPEVLRLMDKLYFDTHRLGELSGKIAEIEPVIRNADLLSFDISAIRQADAPGNGNATPNGLYGEEACQLCRYAGMSDKLSSIGFYEMNPAYDNHGQTAHLVAQMIWYFIEGFYNRKKDRPSDSKADFLKYRATFKDSEHEVVFYKSRKSERWWMQVPYPVRQSRNERFHLVPCSYSDYQVACGGEMPDRWWKTFQKLA